MSKDLALGPDLAIRSEHLQWRFSTSGGPGGQHANRASTRAELVVDLDVALPADLAQVIRERLGNRARGGLVVVSVDDTRSQARNREIARERLAELLASALEEPRPRLPTRPTAASEERRLDEKRRRSETKTLRKDPSPE